MSEESQQSATPDVDAPMTLDQVVEEFNVKPQKAPSVQNNVQEFKPAQPQHIDPYDESQLNQWALDTANGQNALQQQVQDLNAKLTQQEQERTKAIVDADIKSAVGKITESVEGIDPLMAELYLNKRAEEHAGFKAAWDNRGSNPKAYDAALTAISNELDGRFQRVDPQIAEDHRAAQKSTQSNNTPNRQTHGNSLEEALANASNDAERNFLWAKIRDGG